jgi:hypothetical protein
VELNAMGFLRRIFRREETPVGPGRDATPGEMLDYLEEHRAAAEGVLLDRYRVCPKCESDYLRVGAWASQGKAGWTVSPASTAA